MSIEEAGFGICEDLDVVEFAFRICLCALPPSLSLVLWFQFVKSYGD